LTSKFPIGKIGKPHGLKGYAYIYLNEYLKHYSYSGILAEVNENEIYIEKINKHLKDRHLVKIIGLDTIEQIENYRGKSVFLKRTHLLELNIYLPWPELFIGEALMTQDKKQPVLSNYYVSIINTTIELTLDNNVFLIPYDKENFDFNGKNLRMNKDLTFYNPIE